jgi:phage tail-like protein
MPTQAGVVNGARFLVEIDSVVRSAFSEITGLSAEIQAIDYREGGDKGEAVRKVAGLRKFSEITLKRGIVNDLTLWNWFRSGEQGAPERRSMSITLLDDDGNPVMRWKVRNAWIVKWEGPTLNACGNDIAIETIVVTHDGFDVVTGS